MRNLGHIVLLLMLPAILSAQLRENELELLHSSLRNAASELEPLHKSSKIAAAIAIRMNRHLNVALHYYTISPDSAIYYFEKGLPLAQNMNVS